ncbi:YlxM family DNA-binding protein [Anoxybacterium hadale]|uniref:YlxM family DNA-binding protein n=1 Tax=Anoxybacterium hadale TaxID=3408580 RepID=A0ACD1A7V1_9FIRM|nr:YlxM family DNA-binding protein [Clostridiales bacterium]
MFDKMIEISMLYDFYGQLLTAKQQEILKLYHEDNYSLSEIAEEFGISRQGVHDAVKKAEKALHEYENKLGLVKKFMDTEDAIAAIDSQLDELIKENDGNEGLRSKLMDLKSIIDRINE